MLQYVDKLQCPLEQKLKLIDSIAEGCRQQAVKEQEAEQALIRKEKHRQEER